MKRNTRTIPRHTRMRSAEFEAKRLAQREFEALFTRKPVVTEAHISFADGDGYHTNVYDIAEFGRRIIGECKGVFATRHSRNSDRIVRVNAFVGDALSVFG